MARSRSVGDRTSLPPSTAVRAPAFAVYTYELDDATGAYVATGVHHDRIALAVPFDLDIELKAVRER